MYLNSPWGDIKYWLTLKKHWKKLRDMMKSRDAGLVAWIKDLIGMCTTDLHASVYFKTLFWFVRHIQ